MSVDDKRVKPIGKHLYILLNKPKGYVCTTSDEHGRKTVMDFLRQIRGQTSIPVGRLDYDTEGMLLMTTDGDLSNRLMHPRNEITKTYVAKIEGEISEEELNKLREGVVLDGVKTKKARSNSSVTMEKFRVSRSLFPKDVIVRSAECSKVSTATSFS
ncbi:MAG: pseudouridine synthase [Christensenellales bacterium]